MPTSGVFKFDLECPTAETPLFTSYHTVWTPTLTVDVEQVLNDLYLILEGKRYRLTDKARQLLLSYLETLATLGILEEVDDSE